MDRDAGFQALADPVRRDILVMLAAREECRAGEIAEHIRRVGRTAVSTHLQVLHRAGLVTERRDGRFRYYSLNLNSNETAEIVLAFVRGLFQAPLEELSTNVESTATPTDERDGQAERSAPPRRRGAAG